MKLADHLEYIDEILNKVNQAVDARGIDRAILHVQIAQMLTTLSKGLQEDEEARKAEQDLMQKQIDDLIRQLSGQDSEIEKITIDLDPRHPQEENQNGRINIEPAVVYTDPIPADD